MAATTSDSEVIKEFLFSLGFKIDEASMKKFSGALTGTTQGALGVGGALFAAGMAVEKFVENIADGMEKLFYISQRTGASVTNLKAMEGAFQSAGFAAGKGTEFIEELSGKLRSQPGMQEFIKNMFHIDTADMDKADAALAIMKKLAEIAKTQSYAVAAKQAEFVFGMNERDFKTAVENVDKITKIEEDRKNLIKESGVNMQGLAEQSVDFNNNLRKMGADLGAIGSQIAEVLMPAVNAMLRGVERALHGTVRAISSITHATKEDWINTLVATSEAAQQDPMLAESLAIHRTPGQIASAAEQQFGLPPGILMAIRETESGGGKNLVGPEVNGQQAFGPYQISSKNFSSLNTSKDEVMTEEGGSRSAAEILQENLKIFKGDLVKAVAAYNSNPAHVQRAIEQWHDKWLEHMADETGHDETLNYVLKVNKAFTGSQAAANGITYTQNNTVNVTGTDASSIGKAVNENLKRQHGDAVRDLRTLNATPGRS